MACVIRRSIVITAKNTASSLPRSRFARLAHPGGPYLLAARLRARNYVRVILNGICIVTDSRNPHARMQIKLHPGCTLAAMLLLAGCTSSPGKPQNTHVLPECGWLPNCINSQSGRGAQASEPIRANAEQWQELKAWIARQEGWEITVDDGHFMQAIITTPLMKFRDDVQLLFLPDDRLIQVRSSSQLGFSDLGTNARRVEALRDQIRP